MQHVLNEGKVPLGREMIAARSPCDMLDLRSRIWELVLSWSCVGVASVVVRIWKKWTESRLTLKGKISPYKTYWLSADWISVPTDRSVLLDTSRLPWALALFGNYFVDNYKLATLLGYVSQCGSKPLFWDKFAYAGNRGIDVGPISWETTGLRFERLNIVSAGICVVAPKTFAVAPNVLFCSAKRPSCSAKRPFP